MLLEETQQLALEVPALLDKRPTKSITERVFVEDSIRLDTGYFGKKVLVPLGTTAEDALIGKSGTFILECKKFDVRISYKVNLNTDPIQIELKYNKINSSGLGGTHEQIIKIDCRKIKFGYKPDFLCPSCSRCCTTLFINPEKKAMIWGCRRCHEIDYSVCYINKNTPHGKIFYLENRRENLIRQFPDYKRFFYGGQLTKKLQKFANLYARSGLDAPESLKQLIGIEMILMASRSGSTCNE